MTKREHLVMACSLTLAACSATTTTSKHTAKQRPGVLASNTLGTMHLEPGPTMHVVLRSPPGSANAVTVSTSKPVAGAGIAISARLTRFLNDQRFVDARITETTTWQSGAVRRRTSHHIFRVGDMPAPVCRFQGNSSTRPGPKCGSGGYDSVRLVQFGGHSANLKWERHSRGGGTFSEKSQHGCSERSPVRSEKYVTYWELSDQGRCRSVKPPRSR